ncbi:hypothetical protein RvY_10775 [Ramazzottius varieornatus]|uniref:Uncharacterized protein n=1 Tax=Ramazzottius varieornatus TaxID=947166 RepID=A0A1D1VDV6_RAMVA|nr:hypothetical protein RvY_10775 [Ramazzottius varieornatus]
MAGNFSAKAMTTVSRTATTESAPESDKPIVPKQNPNKLRYHIISPSVASMKKNKMDQNVGMGIRRIASGKATNANPEPTSKTQQRQLDKVIRPPKATPSEKSTCPAASIHILGSASLLKSGTR